MAEVVVFALPVLGSKSLHCPEPSIACADMTFFMISYTDIVAFIGSACICVFRCVGVLFGPEVRVRGN